MDPTHGATTEPVVFAQLTVPAGSTFTGVISAQGKSKAGREDWTETAMSFSNRARAPPPPPNPWGPPPAPPTSLGDGIINSLDVTTMSSKAGYSTYQISATFDKTVVEDVYALFGESGSPLTIPAAFQVAAPFGVDVGPTNPQFWPIMADSQFDSFLTIGLDGLAASPGALSTIGIDFASWTEQRGINSDNGAVFFMDPTHGATSQTVVLAQITVATGTRFNGAISLQGKTVGGGDDWVDLNKAFTERGQIADARPPPPPPRPPPPPIQVDHCWIPPSYSTTPCQNGATCITTGQTYSCTCTSGFTGKNCQTSLAPPPPPPPPPSNSHAASHTTVVMTDGIRGYTTYQLAVSLGPGSQNIYTIFGDQSHGPLVVPAAYQAPAPFGADLGGVNPAFFAVTSDAQYDSWLTVGTTSGNSGELSSIGIPFESWTADTGISADDGAVFWMDPTAGPRATSGLITVGQLTVRTGFTNLPVRMDAQGKSMFGVADWEAELNFQVAGDAASATVVGGGH